MKVLTIISLVVLVGNSVEARTLSTDYADFESALSSRKQFKKKFRTVFIFVIFRTGCWLRSGTGKKKVSNF